MKSVRTSGVVMIILAVILAAPAAHAGGDSQGVADYNAKCSSCHAKDGSGSTPMGKKMELRDLGSNEVQAQTDQQLVDITAKGKGKMPKYAGKLSEAQIKAIVAHIRTFKK
ncbi:MAG TPA: cytochrome c [Thermoanaerobaculia bacterium]|nr:cytochrome c [Thermoanaerobaculia bacterium]